MEKEKYPILEEDESAGMCSEPSAAVTYSEKEQLDVPVLGPSTWEEAMNDLDASEKEFEAGECIPWKNVVSEIKERYRHHAY